MATKYKYVKVIQQNFGNGWEDVDEYEANAIFKPTKIHRPATKVDGVSKREISCFRYDLHEYKLMGYPTRSINRRIKIA